MPTPKRPISIAINNDGTMEVIGAFPDTAPEQRAARKAVSTRCGHVKRRLLAGEPLTGKLLEFALDEVVGGDSNIAAKLKAGQTLSDYELHLMVDVYLLHRRLRAD